MIYDPIRDDPEVKAQLYEKRMRPTWEAERNRLRERVESLSGEEKVAVEKRLAELKEFLSR